MMPIRKGDGTALSASGFSEVRKGDGTVLWSAGADIPDSVVTRADDDTSTTTREPTGVQFNLSTEWPDEIDVRLSFDPNGNYDEVRIHRKSDFTELGSASLSNTTSGDVVTLSLSSTLQSSTAYLLVFNPTSTGISIGYLSSPSFPVSSDDGVIEVTDGGFYDGSWNSQNRFYAAKSFGNIQ